MSPFVSTQNIKILFSLNNLFHNTLNLSLVWKCVNITFNTTNCNPSPIFSKIVNYDPVICLFELCYQLHDTRIPVSIDVEVDNIHEQKINDSLMILSTPIPQAHL